MHPRVFAALLMLVATVSCGHVSATGVGKDAGSCGSLPSQPIYDQLLEAMLPTDFGVSFSGSSESVVVVRKAPGDETPETHIVIRRHTDGRFKLAVSRPEASIFVQMNRLLDEAPTMTLSNLCDRVRLLRREVIANDDSELHKTLAMMDELGLSTHVDSDLYLDAPRYDVSVLSPMNRVRVTLYGPNLQSDGPHALIVWSERLIKDVEAQIKP